MSQHRTKSVVLTAIPLSLAVLLAFFAPKTDQKPQISAQKTINVPYTAQAPTSDWVEPWANACEETSIYMVNSFYQGEAITTETAVKNIKEIFAIKNAEFKVNKDESLETMAALVQKMNLPWSTKIVNNPTVQDLKVELSKNHPIIVPVFMPSLWTSTFKGNGPDYHVLVLIGYDDKKGEFITNDPGTSDGQNRRYPYQKFVNAIHDLDQKNYQAGKRAVLFTEPIN